MTESGRVSFQDLKAGLVARGCIIFLLFFAFVIGIWVGGSVLHDPDTCWLLAVGKQIIDSGTIPFVDSFSYTFPHLASDGAINGI